MAVPEPQQVAVPVLDYDNYQFATQETPEFMSEVRDKLTSRPRKGYHVRQAFGENYGSPEVADSASTSALTFLDNINPESVLELLEDQALDVYQGTKIVGSYTIRIKCLRAATAPLIHINTEWKGQIGESDQKVVHEAILSGKLETLSQKSCETYSNGARTEENICYLEKQPSGSFLVNVMSTKDGNLLTWDNEFPARYMEGFVSESAHVLLTRFFACDEKLPDDFSVLSMDGTGRIHKVKYKSLQPKMLVFRLHRVECFGISRTSQNAEKAVVQTDEYFLNRRLVYRQQQETDIISRSMAIPPFTTTEFVKPLETTLPVEGLMEEDWFIRIRREEQKALFEKKYANTAARYPQLMEPLREMVHLVLTFRPDDIFGFVTQSFAHWRHLFREQATATETASEKKEEEHPDTTQPIREANVNRLLRAYSV